MEGVDGLSLGGWSGLSLLSFAVVSSVALRNVNARRVDLSKVMLSMEWVEKASAYGVRDRLAPWEWSYMDIVASVCSSIGACAAEREVRECMELLKKSFGIDQQCGCVNANAKRKANVKKKKEDNEEAT